MFERLIASVAAPAALGSHSNTRSHFKDALGCFLTRF